ncbi:hypothetical protein [Candidatus Aeolococcus gillhamiae]
MLALLMRIQLAEPQNKFLTPARYNQIFTMRRSRASTRSRSG